MHSGERDGYKCGHFQLSQPELLLLLLPRYAASKTGQLCFCPPTITVLVAIAPMTPSRRNGNNVSPAQAGTHAGLLNSGRQECTRPVQGEQQEPKEGRDCPERRGNACFETGAELQKLQLEASGRSGEQ